MTAPAGLLAAATLAWGYFCGAMIAAVPIALLVEAWRWTSVRFDLSAKDFQRIADFCTWLFVLETGYFIVTKGWPFPILVIFEWLPLVVAPLLVAQLYSGTGRVRLSALVLSLRTQNAGALAASSVDLSFAYAGICALAAGTANLRTPWYFAAVLLLALWALSGARSRSFPVWCWPLLVGLAAAGGYAGQHGLSQLQTWIFNMAIDYFHVDMARFDPYRSTTDIGHIGELKSSDRIVLRVEVGDDARMPLLLRRATFDTYAAGTWVARGAPFTTLNIDQESGRWILAADRPVRWSVSVRESLQGDTGVLAVPHASVAVMSTSATTLSRNRLGTIRIEHAPGLVTYSLLQAASADTDAPPGENDLRLPARETAALRRISAELALPSLGAEAAASKLKQYFAGQFRYTTFRADRVVKAEAISEFLLNSHLGHCEYFATATVLLARAAGIPARYATGFSVQEYSALEHAYIVRSRHAHAWARLYLNGSWRDIDTTPPQWFADEGQEAPFWEPFNDFVSWLAFRFSEWRADESRNSLAWYVLAGVLFLVLVWRVYRGGGFNRVYKATLPAGEIGGAAQITAFHAVEQSIAQSGLPRHATETHGEWLQRISRSFGDQDRQALRDLLRLHNRERFDPMRMSAVERATFVRMAEQWLAKSAATVVPQER